MKGGVTRHMLPHLSGVPQGPPPRSLLRSRFLGRPATLCVTTLITAPKETNLHVNRPLELVSILRWVV